MRRLGVQATRWHRYGTFTSRNRGSFASCLRLPRSFASQPKRDSDQEPEVTVRQYEQTTLSSGDKVEVDPEAEVRDEQDQLKAKISQLEKELEFLKEGPFGPNSPLIKSLPEDQRVKVLEAMRKDDQEHAHEEEAERKEEEKVDAEFDQMLEDELGAMAKEEEDQWDPTKKVEDDPPPRKESFEVDLQVPDKHHAYVDRFNKTLKSLQGDPTPGQRQDAWRSYRRCKELLSFFLEIVPDEALNILWASQVSQSNADRGSSSHLETLAEDILSNGRDLTQPQWVDYLELLYRNERSDKALALWQSRKDFAADQGSEAANRFWQLGVKIMVANNQLQRAEKEAVSFLTADESHDPRILIPVAVAWAQSPDIPQSANGNRPWTLYLKLKMMLGSNINMDDYDALSVGFLKAGQASLALAIFKDMMLTGRNSTADSATLYKAALGLVGNLHTSSINESDVNKVSLGALTFLPKDFQNKFFYASWMKKLIGMGEIDSAAKVVELMYERGVSPDPKHLNGIMGAWFREGGPVSRNKAERLGWAMIQERIDRAPHGTGAATKPSVYDPEAGAGVPRYMQRRVPPASIETFSVLLLYYTRQGHEQLINYLVRCLSDARLKPNTFFLNHLLYNELRQQNIFGVWSGYQEMKAILKPDLETFACLWDCGKLQYTRTRPEYDSRFPNARELYKETISWFTSLTPHHQKMTRTAFSTQLYEQIVRCFCVSLDLQGTLVALRSLKENFGFFPDQDASRLLIFLIVRITAPQADTTRTRRRPVALLPRSNQNLENAAKLIDALRDYRITRLSEQGIAPEDLDDDAQKQFEVDLMSDVLRAVLRRLSKDTEKVENKIRVAAEEMGAANLGLGEPVKLEV